jgi:ankyrin repeat protein
MTGLRLSSAVLALMLLTSCGKKIQKTAGTGNHKVSQNASVSYDASQALLAGIEAKELMVVRQALVERADPNYITPKGIHVLNLAISKGKMEIVLELLNKGADVNAVNGNSQDSALLCALKSNNPDIAKYLIQKGADTNHINHSNQTPLYLSIQNKLDEVARLLIMYGADVSIRTQSGLNMLALAKRRGLNKTILSLLQTALQVDKNNISAPMISSLIQQGDSDSISFIGMRSPELIKELANGNNFLSMAIKTKDQAKRMKIVSTLIESGLSADGELDDNMVPLVESVVQKDLFTTKLLFINGANINKTTPVGRSALAYAAKSMQDKVAEYLFNNGALSEYRIQINGRVRNFRVCLEIPSKRSYLRRYDDKANERAEAIEELLECR